MQKKKERNQSYLPFWNSNTGNLPLCKLEKYFPTWSHKSSFTIVIGLISETLCSPQLASSCTEIPSPCFNMAKSAVLLSPPDVPVDSLVFASLLIDALLFYVALRLDVVNIEGNVFCVQMAHHVGRQVVNIALLSPCTDYQRCALRLSKTAL